jgi:hypothetical protein
VSFGPRLARSQESNANTQAPQITAANSATFRQELRTALFNSVDISFLVFFRILFGEEEQ